MKEKNSVSKSKWKRLFRKKWFFPAFYLGLSAVLLTAVLWYQSGSDAPNEAQDQDGIVDSLTLDGEEAEPVAEQEEVVKSPVSADANTSVVTKFYDYNADSESQENALVLYDNKYYQSTGVDIAAEDGASFDVTASLSGTVTEVKEDALYGNVVQLDHANGITTYYASLEDVQVETGQEVKQGDVLASAGQSLFAKDKATHVHFEVRNGDTPVDPEAYFNQPASKLLEAQEEQPVQEEAEDTAADGSDEAADDSQSEEDTEEETPEDGASDDETDEEADSATEETTSSSSSGQA